MELLPWTNPGPATVMRGGRMVPPGETVMLPADWLQPEPEPEPGPEPASEHEPDDAALRELLEGTVASVSEALPSLSAAELSRLYELEAGEQNRVTLLAAITAAMG